MKIKLTEFAKRHFDSKFGATKILDFSTIDFEDYINSEYSPSFSSCTKDGYAPFCKLITIRNFTKTKTGTMPISIENYQYIRSGYSARTKEELPVFSRWLELPVSPPTANWLSLVLYSKKQIDKEAMVKHEKDVENWENCIFKIEDKPEPPQPFDAEWGIVAILAQMSSEEEPMKPETMVRNALGITEGGSGIPIDKVKYAESVEFWSKNVTVK